MFEWFCTFCVWWLPLFWFSFCDGVHEIIFDGDVLLGMPDGSSERDMNANGMRPSRTTCHVLYFYLSKSHWRWGNKWCEHSSILIQSIQVEDTRIIFKWEACILLYTLKILIISRANSLYIYVAGATRTQLLLFTRRFINETRVILRTMLSVVNMWFQLFDSFPNQHIRVFWSALLCHTHNISWTVP